MSTNDTAGTPASLDPRFCPECGHRAEAADRFCRSCGHQLTAVPASVESASVESASGGERPGRRRKALVAASLLALASAAVALVLVLGGAFSSAQPDAAEAAAQGRLAAQRERQNAQFEELMNQRDALFVQERRYLNAMGDARDKLRGYRAAENEYKAENKRIEQEFADESGPLCPVRQGPVSRPDYPEIPKVPGFVKQTRQLRGAAVELEQSSASLASVEPGDELRVLHTQLLASVDALKDEASHNADVLDEAVEPAEGEGYGVLDKGKLRTLRAGGALPAIRQLNLAASGVIDRLKLRRLDYDVRGGRDLDSADHSDLV